MNHLQITIVIILCIGWKMLNKKYPSCFVYLKYMVNFRSLQSIIGSVFYSTAKLYDSLF